MTTGSARQQLSRKERKANTKDSLQGEDGLRNKGVWRLTGVRVDAGRLDERGGLRDRLCQVGQVVLQIARGPRSGATARRHGRRAVTDTARRRRRHHRHPRHHVGRRRHQRMGTHPAERNQSCYHRARDVPHINRKHTQDARANAASLYNYLLLSTLLYSSLLITRKHRIALWHSCVPQEHTAGVSSSGSW